MNLAVQMDGTEIQYTQIHGFAQIGGVYGTLRANKDRFRILSNAQWQKSVDGVTAAVYQDIELARIPIFQYAVFYNVIMEYTPQPPMVISGPVHCNTNIYMNPAGALTFKSAVNSAGTVVMGPNPAGPFPNLGGATTFGPPPLSGVSALTLPIGTNNTPAAVQQALGVPPGAENPLSSLGRQRYYNQ